MPTSAYGVTMRLLVLGGSVFVSAAVVRHALAAGHDVTAVTRGLHGTVPDGVTHVRADRTAPDGLASVAGEAWDAVVDVSSQPGQVRSAVAQLATDGAHYLYVSSGSAYADTATPGLTEDGPLLPALAGDALESMADYGGAKVACERAVLDGASRATVVRPGLIGGAGDTSGRSGYWPWRFAHPSGPAVLVPDAPDLLVQLIDVEDLAAWIVHLLDSGRTGVFNAVGHATPFPAALSAAHEAALAVGGGEQAGAPDCGGGQPGEPTLVAVDGPWLAAHEVAPWAGPRSMPLWLDDPEWAGFGARSNVAALAAGLRLRPLAETFAATLRWHETVGGVPTSGLSDEDERELLALASS
ncbi:NAD-dependent epimerase/dehydratase family protein [Miniimonas arenae]|uniref:NAD-dependent epimerase/dehydratase family protein n=2 Tax=Miniimonas arenae TaxID=676201 RepID=A0A5C5B8K0_9MICO|nr:NAD-dependent epimerase/dehydratase family protein [Miniimonas arenae]